MVTDVSEVQRRLSFFGGHTQAGAGPTGDDRGATNFDDDRSTVKLQPFRHRITRRTITRTTTTSTVVAVAPNPFVEVNAAVRSDIEQLQTDTATVNDLPEAQPQQHDDVSIMESPGLHPSALGTPAKFRSQSVLTADNRSIDSQVSLCERSRDEGIKSCTQSIEGIGCNSIGAQAAVTPCDDEEEISVSTSAGPRRLAVRYEPGEDLGVVFKFMKEIPGVMVTEISPGMAWDRSGDAKVSIVYLFRIQWSYCLLDSGQLDLSVSNILFHSDLICAQNSHGFTLGFHTSCRLAI